MSPVKQTLTFNDFIKAKGLEKDFARFRLKNDGKYPRKDELREAFLEARDLLEEFANF